MLKCVLVVVAFVFGFLSGILEAQTLKPQQSLAGYTNAQHSVVKGMNGEGSIVFTGIENRGPGTLYCLTGVGEFWTGGDSGGARFDRSSMPCVATKSGSFSLPISVPREYWGKPIGLTPITIYEDGRRHPQGWEAVPSGPARNKFYSERQKKDVTVLAVIFDKDGSFRAATDAEAKLIKD